MKPNVGGVLYGGLERALEGMDKDALVHGGVLGRESPD